MDALLLKVGIVLIIFHRATDSCLGREIGITASKRELESMMMMVKTTLPRLSNLVVTKNQNW